jgi:hypothetical protein
MCSGSLLFKTESGTYLHNNGPDVRAVSRNMGSQEEVLCTTTDPATCNESGNSKLYIGGVL